MKRNLLNGCRYIYSNENYQVQNDSDDIRGAEVWYCQTANINKYVIQFNGVWIHASKTFGSMNKRLNTLIVDWHLELESIEE